MSVTAIRMPRLIALAGFCWVTSVAMAAVPTLPQGDGSCPNTTLASLSSKNKQGNRISAQASISGDGRFVAFASFASNLVPGDGNGSFDVFLRDTKRGTLTQVSVRSNGAGGKEASYRPSISADGRLVAFDSRAHNLVKGDTNGVSDIFLHDVVTGVTRRVSVGPGGAQGDGPSYWPAISADGRFVTFESEATTLVPGDANLTKDIFVHDIQTATTTLVSLDSNGVQANQQSYWPAISADGRFVAFTSLAWNLVPGDTNWQTDVFHHDTWTGMTTRVSVSSAGAQGDDDCLECSISGDGRFVAFETQSWTLVPRDTNGVSDIFLHDTLASTTTRVSVGVGGAQADGRSAFPSLSADSRFVAFDSRAANLVPWDTNGVSDVFVHDILAGTTTRASVDSNWKQGEGSSLAPAISADGRFVAFESYAENLVLGDTNGWLDIFRRCMGPAPLCYTKYCTVIDGSLDNTSNLDATGCDLSGPIHLDLSNGPPRQFTYLLVGSGSNVVDDPAGALGDLCIVGGFLSRYVLDMGATSAAGAFSVDISNSASGGPGFGIPASGGAAFQAGETWNFQYWHRNPIGQPSGFSEAVTITFQ